MAVLALGLLAACGGGGDNTGGESKPADDPPKEEDTEKEADAGDEAAGDFEEMTIAIGHATADTDDGHYHQGALFLKDKIEEATGGKVTIEIHPNAVLGGEREMIEALQLGTLDMVLTSSGPVGNFASKSNAFDFPFLFRDHAHAYAVLDGELGEEVNEQLEEVGIKVLAWAENGFRNITNDVRPIVNPEDLAGIKIRTMENQVHMAAFEAYGASPTPMAFNELFTSLQQGVVDGEENPLGVIMPNKFYEVQKYLTLSSHVYSPAPLLIAKAKFDSFSPELQEIFMDAAIEMRDFERNFLAEMDEKYVETAIENGMEVVTPEEFNYDAFLEATQPVYEQYKDEFGEFHERIMAVE